MAQYGNSYGGQDNYGGQSYGGYDAQGYGQASPYGGSGYADPQSNIEMAPMGSNSASILDECRAIDHEIDAINANLDQLQRLQAQTLGDVSANSKAARELDQLSADTMDRYRELTPRVRALNSDPAAQNPRNSAQVTRVDRTLRDAIRRYQSVESTFQRGMQDQIARQYRIVRPDADEAEVRGAVEDTRGEVFQRALMQSGRQGQANAALSAVQDRHDQIRKIERQMAELTQMFEDMNAVVVHQNDDVMRIEESGDRTVRDLEHGKKQVDKAVEKGWAARKKKWICLGIVVLIIIVVVVAVLAVLGSRGVLTNSGGGNNKRSIVSASLRGVQSTGGGFILPRSADIPAMARARARGYEPSPHLF